MPEIYENEIDISPRDVKRMTLIKDLIDIPDRVYKDQYVLRLSEGVTRPQETLSDYVVTPELSACFDAALSMIRSAVANRTSKAAFLHGSFGSGKSHYMAVLHLILQGNPAARGIVELAPVIQKHNDWLAGKESADFLKGDYWRLRGKLDVPKERWVSFPHCEGADGTLVVAWAGYDHLQLARAISAYYVDVQERLGGRDDPRLVPLLACLIELLPWLKQWHNEVDPEFGIPMGDYFEGFIQEEARQLGKTVPEIKAWEPPQRTTRRPRASGGGTRSSSRRRTEAVDSPEA